MGQKGVAPALGDYRGTGMSPCCARQGNRHESLLCPPGDSEGPVPSLEPSSRKWAASSPSKVATPLATSSQEPCHFRVSSGRTSSRSGPRVGISGRWALFQGPRVPLPLTPRHYSHLSFPESIFSNTGLTPPGVAGLHQLSLYNRAVPASVQRSPPPGRRAMG